MAVLKTKDGFGPVDDALVVGAEQKGGSLLVVEVAHDVEQGFGALGVEVGCGLVGQYE
jgi:hypothetical protein